MEGKEIFGFFIYKVEMYKDFYEGLDWIDTFRDDIEEALDKGDPTKIRYDHLEIAREKLTRFFPEESENIKYFERLAKECERDIKSGRALKEEYYYQEPEGACEAILPQLRDYQYYLVARGTKEGTVSVERVSEFEKFGPGYWHILRL